MDSVAPAVPSAALLAVALLACGGLVWALVWAAGVRGARRGAAHAAARADDEVAALAARVDQLTAEVDRVRRARDGQGREFLITTLGEAPAALPGGRRTDCGGSAGAVLQQRLVTAIRRGTADRPAETLLVSLAVRTMAVGHGVRRALSADNRERIAWEMRSAARQSRRARKQEVRAARREARARRLTSPRRDAA